MLLGDNLILGTIGMLILFETKEQCFSANEHCCFVSEKIIIPDAPGRKLSPYIALLPFYTVLNVYHKTP